MLDAFLQKHALNADFAHTAKCHFIPLANKLVEQAAQQNMPYFVGINGCQGSGKSTVSAFIAEYIQANNALNVVVLSLDDFYFSQQERQQLAKKVHPLLATRGVPGTHNTARILASLHDLKTNTVPVTLPIFNKANDNPFPENEFPVVTAPVDIVIFEGWCWGVTAQENTALIEPINALESTKDASGQWRNYVNNTLKSDYPALYQYMDYWVMLKAPSFEQVYCWRLEQEQKLRNNTNQQVPNALMNNSEIKQFIQFYQRLTTHALLTLPNTCHQVFVLDDDRKITTVLYPLEQANVQ